jgi:hypothetical protein
MAKNGNASFQVGHVITPPQRPTKLRAPLSLNPRTIVGLGPYGIDFRRARFSACILGFFRQLVGRSSPHRSGDTFFSARERQREALAETQVSGDGRRTRRYCIKLPASRGRKRPIQYGHVARSRSP